MTALRVIVSGSGRMGSQVVGTIAAQDDMAPVAVVDALAKGESFEGLPLFRDAERCFAAYAADVVVDFTNAAWTPQLCQAALSRGVRPVIGTTGHGDDFLAWLDAECSSRRVGGVLAANFAIGAVLMMHFAAQASPYFEAAEIIELHHDQKVDSPSGTAKATAEMMRAAKGGVFSHRMSEKQPLPGARGAELGGIAIHSVRLPGLVAHQEVIFGGLGQTLSLRHDTTGRDSFMPGVLLAARRVMGLDRLVVGLDRLLGLR